MAASFKVTAAAMVAIVVVAGIVGVVLVVTTSGDDDTQQQSAGSLPAASCTGTGPVMGLHPIVEVSQPSRWAFGPDVVVDPHTGYATVAFAAAPRKPRTPSSLWSVTLPGASGDQQLIRSGNAGGFPAPYDGARPIPAERAHNLGIDAAGDQTLVWREEDKPQKGRTLDRMAFSARVLTSSRPAGGDWSKPTVLDSRHDTTTGVRVAVNDRGAAVAVWVHKHLPYVASGTPKVSLYASYRPTAQSKWSDPTLVAQDRLRNSDAGFAFNYIPQVGIDRAGNAVVMYERNPVGGAWVRRRDAAKGSWMPATQLSAASPAYVGDSLAVSANGTAAASLQLYVPHNKNHFVWQTARMDPIGTWTRATRPPAIPDTSTPEGLAIDGNGRALAVWRTKNDDLMVMASDPDGNWRRSTLLARDQSKAEPLMGVMVAMNDRGDAFAAWETAKGTSAHLNGSYQRAGQAWTPVQRLTQEHVSPGDYAAAINPRGQAALTWTPTSGSPYVMPETRPARTVWVRQISPCP